MMESVESDAGYLKLGIQLGASGAVGEQYMNQAGDNQSQRMEGGSVLCVV